MDASILLHDAQFSDTFLAVRARSGGLVPLTYNTPQRMMRDALTAPGAWERGVTHLILKGRQMGITTLIQSMIYRRLITSSFAAVTYTQDNDATSNVRQMQDRFHDNLRMPDSLIPPRDKANARETTYPDFDSRHIVMSALASGNKIRSGAYQFAELTEIAFYDDDRAKELMTALTPSLYGPMVCDSTANGARGIFYNMVRQALDGREDYRLHFLPWWLAEWNRESVDEPLTLTDEEQELRDRHGLDDEQIQWRRLMVRQKGRMFQQEYPESVRQAFLKSGGGYFGEVGPYCTVPDGISPSPEGWYIAGVDWGTGVGKDYTVISIIDAMTGDQVYLWRTNYMGPSEMASRLAGIIGRWDCRTVVVESNSIGTTFHAMLVNEMYDKGIGHIPVRKFTMTNRSKAGIMQELSGGLAEGHLALLKSHQAQRDEFESVTAVQNETTGTWSYRAKDKGSGGHDDCVIATGLAWQAAVKYYRHFNH